VQEGLKKDLGKTRAEKISQGKMSSRLLRGKVSRGYILFRYGAGQNITSLTCGNWSRLTGVD
jgi:hypothetical protein